MTTTERLTFALVIVLLTAVLAACASDHEAPEGDDPKGVTDAGEPADPVSNATRPDASVEIDVSVGEEGLLVSYSLTNDGDDDLLVVNRLPEPVGAGTAYVDNIAYVTGKGDGRVQVAHRVFPLPDTDRVAFAQAPRVGGTLVAPGNSVTGSLQLELPLARRQPFGEDLGYGTIELPDPVQDVEFCVGAIPAPFPASVTPTPDEDEPELMLLAHGTAAHEAQYLFCSDPVALD